jgi:uncharacterized membrane protein
MSTDNHPSLTPTHIMYALHLLAPFTFLILAVVALIIGMVNREHVQGSWLDSHYSWLSRTFWWGLLWSVVAWGAYLLLTALTLGLGAIIFWLLPAAVVVWYVYRVVRGLLSLNALKPI